MVPIVGYENKKTKKEEIEIGSMEHLLMSRIFNNKFQTTTTNNNKKEEKFNNTVNWKRGKEYCQLFNLSIIINCINIIIDILGLFYRS